MSDEDYIKGESVMAKWAGSKRFFKGTVIKTTKELVDVQFEDGSKSTVKKTDTQKVETSSPKKSNLGRPRSRSTNKKSPVSRSRSKSAGRLSKARSRSPSKSITKSPAKTSGRKTSKSPARKASKSPARKASKSPARKASKSPAKKATKLPARKPSKSPARKASKSPARKASKSPARKASKSPGRSKRKTTPSPSPKKKPVQETKNRQGSQSPEKKIKDSPGRQSRKSISTSILSKASSTLASGLKQLSVQAKKLDDNVEIISGESKQRNIRPSLDFKEKIALLEEEQKQQSEKIFVTRLRSARESTRIQEKRESSHMKGLDDVDRVVSFKSSAASDSGASLLGSLPSLISLLGIPVLVIFLILACARNQGKLFAIPHISKNWRFYITPIPTAIFFGFVLLQGLLTLLPVGPAIEGFVLASKVPRKNLMYRKNGLISLLMTISVLPAAIYFDKLPTEFIRAHFLHLASAGILFSVIFSLALYIKSFYAPPHEIHPSGDSKFFYHNIVVGRQLNPRIGNSLDLKFLLFHVGLIGWAVVDLLLLYKVYKVNQTVHCTLAISATMQLLYIVDLLWREEHLLATASVMYEGLGLLKVLGISVINPFISTLPVFYLVDRKTELSYYCLIGITLLYLIGMYLARKSNSLKYEIKRNPHSPGTRSLQTISSNKKNLICSGLWGIVRHPNYLGDILIFLAWTLPCEFSAGVPYVPVGSITLLLIFRIFQVEKLLEKTHGHAFAQYKKHVPKRLVPYIF